MISVSDAAAEGRMPAPLDLGRHMGSAIGHAISMYRDWIEAGKPADPLGRRMVMGFVLPEFQRPSVWSRAQQIRFMESAWLGIPIGTYSYTELREGGLNDRLLIDGQQRMSALEAYLTGEFAVFGLYWPEVSDAEKRNFRMMRKFPHFLITTGEEQYLRTYYNLMNYGGTAHTEAQRA